MTTYLTLTSVVFESVQIKRKKIVYRNLTLTSVVFEQTVEMQTIER